MAMPALALAAERSLVEQFDEPYLYHDISRRGFTAFVTTRGPWRQRSYKLTQLPEQLARVRSLPWRFDGDSRETELDIALVLHCRTGVIQRALARQIRTMFGNELYVQEKAQGEHFELSYAHKSPNGTKLNLYLVRIPESTDQVWHDTGHLPFPGATQVLRQELLDESEVFMSRTSPTTD